MGLVSDPSFSYNFRGGNIMYSVYGVVAVLFMFDILLLCMGLPSLTGWILDKLGL